MFAKNILDESIPKNDHFAFEWRDAKPESECLAYLRDIILDHELLSGPAGSLIQVAKSKGQVMTRVQTLDRFKKGIMAYQPTPLGGCTNIGQCEDDLKGLNILDVQCLVKSCKHMVLKKSKIEKAIPYQQGFVNSLDPSSISYTMENRELSALLQAKEAFQEIYQEQ